MEGCPALWQRQEAGSRPKTAADGFAARGDSQDTQKRKQIRNQTCKAWDRLRRSDDLTSIRDKTHLKIRPNWVVMTRRRYSVQDRPASGQGFDAFSVSQ
jgi:hypothetical protein